MALVDCSKTFSSYKFTPGERSQVKVNKAPPPSYWDATKKQQ